MIIRLFSYLLSFVLVVFCSPVIALVQSEILVNQHGFMPYLQKQANLKLINGHNNPRDWRLVDQSDKILFGGVTEHLGVDEFSGDEIKSLREELSISQALFADAVGAKRDTVSKWERGDVTPGKSFRRIFHTLKKYGLEAVY